MPKCGIRGGEAPKQPCITEDGKCDPCGRKVALAEEEKEKSEEDQGLLKRSPGESRGLVPGGPGWRLSCRWPSRV